MSRPFILGLTGSIGMGKSAVSAMFRAAGVPVFDADACVRALQGPAGALIPAIEAAFPGTTGPDGVDRAKLGATVFAQPEALARLEAIVHPAVAERRAQFLRDHAAVPLVVYDIPLLFERTGRAGLDAVAVVSARADQQRARVFPPRHECGEVRGDSRRTNARCRKTRPRRPCDRHIHPLGIHAIRRFRADRAANWR